MTADAMTRSERRPARLPTNEPMVEGYLLDTLNPATVDGNGVLTPALARLAVFDLVATYDSSAGDRDEIAAWSMQWKQVGQIVLANVDEDLEADPNVYCAAIKIGNTWRPISVGCQTTAVTVT